MELFLRAVYRILEAMAVPRRDGLMQSEYRVVFWTPCPDLDTVLEQPATKGESHCYVWKSCPA